MVNLLCKRYEEDSGVKSQKSEVRSQKSEVRSQKSEVRSQKSEVRSQKSEEKLKKHKITHVGKLSFIFYASQSRTNKRAERDSEMSYFWTDTK
ncbi:MAG: hypothetical protein C0613_13125 [Desulfobulbaceae bacterium]|nr:MAG: hypothetical protein C0613_13125 [Desulfobulbaceae bacterium]